VVLPWVSSEAAHKSLCIRSIRRRGRIDLNTTYKFQPHHIQKLKHNSHLSRGLEWVRLTYGKIMPPDTSAPDLDFPQYVNVPRMLPEIAQRHRNLDRLGIRRRESGSRSGNRNSRNRLRMASLWHPYPVNLTRRHRSNTMENRKHGRLGEKARDAAIIAAAWLLMFVVIRFPALMLVVVACWEAGIIYHHHHLRRIR
jgi:hypothetical protein